MDLLQVTQLESCRVVPSSQLVYTILKDAYSLCVVNHHGSLECTGLGFVKCICLPLTHTFGLHTWRFKNSTKWTCHPNTEQLEEWALSTEEKWWTTSTPPHIQSWPKYYLGHWRITHIKCTFVTCTKITSHKTFVHFLISYYIRPPPSHQCWQQLSCGCREKQPCG